jgi:hypothetical protein
MGLNLSLAPTLPDAEKDKKIAEQANEPTARLDDNRVLARPGGMYAV